MSAHRDSEPQLNTPPACFETCYQTTLDDLTASAAPVLIGSSFGGGITFKLLQRGAWRGPVVLLAPAVKCYGISVDLPEGCHAIIIHDPADESVPYVDSEAIVRANPGRAELWSSLGGHRLHTLTTDGMLERAVRAQLTRAQILEL